MMDLRTVVENVLSPDQTEQKNAEQALAGLLEHELEATAARLSELVNTFDAKDVIRQSAALALKNAISSKDTAVNIVRQNAWMKITPQIRLYIKKNILEALQTDKVFLGRAVAQVIANIALCEIVRNEWPEIIPFLTNCVQSPESNIVVRQSALEAIGYICEEVNFEAVGAYSNIILTAIVSGMRKEEPSVDIRLAATTALHNSVDFFKGNFEKQEERDYIMTVVCEATQAPDNRLKIVALQCTVKIMQFFYEFMQHYMQKALFPISFQAMCSDVPEIVLQGVEFWSTISESEISLNYEEAEAKDEERIPQHKSHKFVNEYLQYVTPQLLKLLAQQADQEESDEWVPSKAASVCIMLIAQCVGDEVVPHVVPFVSNHVNDTNWHFRDAACVAFGSILEGPDPSKLRNMVDQAYDVILAMMADSSVAVRDSAAWVVQRICQLIREAVLVPQRFYNTVMILRQNLGGAPRVAANVCWALGTLAQASYEAVQSDTNPVPDTFALSQVFTELVDQLFATALRPESAMNNLRTAAFGAIGELISHSPKDCYPAVQKTTVQVLGQLGGILEKEPTLSPNERHQYGDYCQHLLGVLQSALRRLVKEDLVLIADNVVAICYQILEIHRLQRSFQAEPEALLCLQVLVEVLADDFFKYVENLNPHIHLALTCFSEHSIVNGALNFIGELCRTYEGRIVAFVPEYIDRVVALISQINDPSGLVKPKAIQTLGDIAISLGPHFYNYTVMSFECLRAISVPQDHEVWLDILDAILDAAAGIINGLKAEDFTEQAKQVIRVYVHFIVSLIAHIANDPSNVQESTISNAAAIIGEFCQMFGQDIFPLVDRADFYALLNKGRRSSKTKTRNFCSWALKEIKKLKQSQSHARNVGATR